jgi:glycosyltransferase involved in cell wall biosynthesis
MNNNHFPLVSVLMTAYNREQFITEAIESVLASTYSNFELIITDDCSTDRTLEIAREFESKDSRVKVYKNTSNLKDYPNRNKAAEYAQGKYIKYLDSDDWIYPDGLEYCVASMEQFPSAGIGMVFFQNNFSNGFAACWDSEKIIQHHFFVGGCLNIGPSGCIMRRDIFEEFNGFDTRFGVASDNFFNIRLAAQYPVVLLPKEFFFYRVHKGQEINDKKGYLKNNYLYLKELLINVTLPLSENEILQLHKRVDKAFSKDLIRYFLHSRNLGSIKEVMRVTRVGVKDILKSLIT